MITNLKKYCILAIDMKKENLNIAFLIILPVLFYIGVHLLTHYNTHTICIFKLITGHNCPGCGMTRAFDALFQMNFREAYSFNPGIIIIAPLLLFIWIKTLIREVQHKVEKKHS